MNSESSTPQTLSHRQDDAPDDDNPERTERRRQHHARDVADALAAKGVKYAAISFVDMHGKPKSKMVPLSHLSQAALGSEMFTGAALDGVPQDVNDDEVAPHPDLAHPIILPFNREIAWFPGDLWIGDSPFNACSRQILKRVTGDAATLGYTFNLGIETEFLAHGLRPTRSASPDDNLDKPCYDRARCCTITR